MYLAHTVIRRRSHFIIRESYLEGECYHSRDLLDLGGHPRRYIKDTGGNNLILDEWVADNLRKKGLDPDPFELEKLFVPFMDPTARHRMEMLADRQTCRTWKPISTLMRRKILNSTREFDRRRIHFLRFGQMDQRRLDRPAAIYRILLDKSRDEIEQYFMGEEHILRPTEYKSYTYAIFDLQRFFTESCAFTMPEGLDEEKLDHHFIEQVCRLNDDRNFWEGMERDDRLPSYLVRYVIMYFDSVFPGGGGQAEYIRNFMDSHRRYVSRRAAGRLTMSEAATIFGINRGELASLTRTQLKRLFRKKARELHPDKGGSHDKFIELANAYQEILRTKAGKS